MFCNYCGNQLKDDAKFCPSCGTAVEAANKQQASNETTVLDNGVYSQPVQQTVYNSPQATAVNNNVYAQPAQQPAYVQPEHTEQAYYQPAVSDEELSKKQNFVLTFGIIALATATTWMFSFLGIIFGAISLKNAKEYINLTGETPARIKVGKILGKIGLIVGIVMTAILALYIFIIALAAIAGSM